MPHLTQTHWGSEIADILVQTAGLLEGLKPEQWNTPSLCPDWTVRDAAGHIVWRIGTSTRQMLAEGGRAYFGRHLNPMRVIDDLSNSQAQASPETLIREMRHIAALKLGGDGRTGLTELTEALVHGYDIAWPLGISLEIEPRVSAAVAARRQLTLPLQARHVVGNRTLVAIDADWRIGRGAEITGSAEAIVLFLFGRKPLSTKSHH